MVKARLGVLISGRGSNLQALIDACAGPAFPATIALVVSNEAGAFGLARARDAGIATAVFDHRAFPDRPAFDQAVGAVLADAGVDLVCLAGFMRLLSEDFVRTWWDRLVNIHPSLLPAFRGLHVHRRVLAYGARITGCTVHFVRPAMDDGPIIVQAAVAVHAADDEDRLAARVLAEEHRIYPLAVRLFAEGRLTIDGNRVLIADPCNPDRALLNPEPA
ncbi:MAG: phosphoribosylglycinamide formyltransferase [Rhodospirillales bacterium]